MKLEKTQIQRLEKEFFSLFPGESLEIFQSGIVRKNWRNSDGKRKSRKLFNLFTFVDEEIKHLRSKIPQVFNSNSFKSFGKKPKDFGKNSSEFLRIALLFQLGLFGENPKIEVEDTRFGLFYKVQVNGIAAYFNQRGSFRYFECAGKEYYGNIDIKIPIE